MENTSNYLPLFTTLLGGLLAIGGGVVSALLIQRQTAKRENAKIVVEKCEEIFKIIIKTDHYTQFTHNAICDNDFDGDPPEEVNLTQHKWKELEMLTSLYLPNALEVTKEYIKARENHMLKYMHCIYKRSVGENPINENFIENIEIIHKEYKTASCNLKNAIINYFPIKLR